MTDPKITIIVRTKDRPKLLGEALKSINDAHIPNLEVVVVNDGQRDVQKVVTTTLTDKTTYRYVFPKTRLGRSKAGNLGAETARSPYIFFLDDDDLLGPEFLSLLNRIDDDDHGNRMLYGKVEAFHHNPDGSRGETYRFFGRDFDPVALLWENYIPFNAAIIPRNLFLEVGGLDSQLAVFEDWDLFLKLSEISEIAYHPLLVAYYRLSKDAFILGGNAELQQGCRIRILEKYWSRYTPRTLARIYDLFKRDLKNELIPEVLCFQAERAQWLKMDLDRKKFIDDLTNQISLKNDYIADLTKEIEKRGNYIDELTLEIQKKGNYIDKLGVAIHNKGKYIKSLKQERALGHLMDTEPEKSVECPQWEINSPKMPLVESKGNP